MERNVMGELNVYRGVRREAELQRNREEARHGPAHGRQVLEGGHPSPDLPGPAGPALRVSGSHIHPHMCG